MAVYLLFPRVRPDPTEDALGTEVCLPGYCKTACKAAAELAPVPYTCVECVICA